MIEKWGDSQWECGLQPGCRQTCRIKNAQMGVNMAEVQTVDKMVIVNVNVIVIVSMDATVRVT